MPVLKSVKGCFFIKWLHAGHYNAAASLECHSCERFLSENDIRRLMCERRFGGFVITHLTVPVGYVIYEHKQGLLKIQNLVVHSDFRRRGMATLLLEKLKTRKDWQNISVHVRESNLAAQLFLRDSGFHALQVKPSYFRDSYPGLEERESAYHFIFRKGKNTC